MTPRARTCPAKDGQTKRTRAKPALKIANYNVNGVNGRLPRLLEWLAETGPDIVCLQELMTDDSKHAPTWITLERPASQARPATRETRLRPRKRLRAKADLAKKRP
jgi:endonuclease/exonuclease/phosphatase family metal-dependent hydrolase